MSETKGSSYPQHTESSIQNVFDDPPPGYIEPKSMHDTSTYTTDHRLLRLAKEKGISPYFASQLSCLQDFSSIRLFLDDSGSMNDRLVRRPIPDGCTTRWDLQRRMVSEIFDLMSSAKPIEVYSLNCGPNGTLMTSLSQLKEYFDAGPANAGTPTREKMSETLANLSSERGVLSAVITDGEPNGGYGPFASFLADVQRRNPNHYIQIGLCTDDKSVIKAYNNYLDKLIDRLDVTEIYENEEPGILSKQGRRFTFTRADWVVKFLVGPRIIEWDKLDEDKLSKEELKMVKEFKPSVFDRLTSTSSSGDIRKICSVM